MWGYYYQSRFYGVWDSDAAARAAGEAAGIDRYDLTVYPIVFANGAPPQPVGGGAMAEFLALGQ